MRSLLTIIMFLAASVCAFAQRPWLLRTPMTAGPNPKVVATSSSVFVFDTAAMRTFDHGTTWEPLTSVPGQICAITDFTAGLTLLASYQPAERTINMYFSNAGSTWTSFATIPNAQRPVALTASGTEWYLACEQSNVIYRFGDNLELMQLPAGASVVDLQYWQSELFVSDPNRGVYVSGDRGATWKLIPLIGAGPLHTSSMGIYVASERGVHLVDLAAGSASVVGSWPSLQRQPRITDIDSYLNTLYAYTDDGGYQLYRLQTKDWEPIGYPLPGTKASRTSSVLAIDAGYAVLAHAIVEGFTDSAGVYVYDLNDFTDVTENVEMSAGAARIIGDQIHLTADMQQNVSVTIWSLTGELLHTLTPRLHTITIPEMGRGVYVARIETYSQGNVQTLLFVR